MCGEAEVVGFPHRKCCVHSQHDTYPSPYSIVEEIQASLIQQMKSLNARHAILFKHTKSVLKGPPAEAPRHHVMYAPTKIST